MPARERHEVVEEVEQSRLGPVDVVDDHHERPFVGRALEQAPHRPERLLDLGGAGRQPYRLQHQVHARLVSVEELLDPVARVGPTDLLDDLRERPVGHVLSVREAPPDRDRCVTAASARSSRARRDLPIPAGPTSVIARQPGSARASARALRSSPSSCSRPTSGLASGPNRTGSSANSSNAPGLHLRRPALQVEQAPGPRPGPSPSPARRCSRRAGSAPLTQGPRGARRR